MPSYANETNTSRRILISICIALTSILFPPLILLWVLLGVLRVRGRGTYEAKPLNREEVLLMSGIDTIDGMRGAEFEAYLGVLFQHGGYTVEHTPHSGDFGADLILRKDGERIVVQAKRYSTNVGMAAVQEIAAAKNHYGADQAWVVTNSYFTRPACTLARSNQVLLVDRDRLLQLMEKAGPSHVRRPIASMVPGFLAR